VPKNSGVGSSTSAGGAGGGGPDRLPLRTHAHTGRQRHVCSCVCAWLVHASMRAHACVCVCVCVGGEVESPRAGVRQARRKAPLPGAARNQERHSPAVSCANVLVCACKCAPTVSSAVVLVCACVCAPAVSSRQRRARQQQTDGAVQHTGMSDTHRAHTTKALELPQVPAVLYLAIHASALTTSGALRVP